LVQILLNTIPKMNRIRAIAKRPWVGMPPWIILGAVIILVPIFVFWTLENIHRQKENTTLLLLEKAAALIRSFEAGYRTGMRRSDFQLQKLLMETAQQPDIVYLMVTDRRGTILAHSDPAKIGGAHGKALDLQRISRSQEVEGRQVSNPDGTTTFEVFRQFSPTRRPPRRHHARVVDNRGRELPDNPIVLRQDLEKIIFVGLDMGPIEAARKEDARHTVLMALVLLLIGFAGIVSLFLTQAYRSAKTSLTKIKAFSDTVVENIPSGLVAIGADGKVASFNQTAEAVLQLSSNEALGKEASEILPEQLCSLIDELGADGGIVEKDMDCALKDGKMIPLEVVVSSLQADDDALLGKVVLFRDLTEVQNLKRELERSQRLASLGRLAAGIAHEIRNPLSSIKGFATYFKERYKEIPEDQKTAEIMVQEVERLNRVVGQLLEFARPIAIQKRAASLQAVIRHSLKMIERQAQAKDIKILTSLSPEVKEVSIDPDRINQVLLNLYINSIEAMAHEGTLSVVLSRDENLQMTQVIVSDTGVGIKKADLPHVFDPYFTTKQSGTGLGLAIVHKIIDSHKGTVRVESEAGKGTTVKILLPATEE
jgi:two-component system sensor histidine kinase HydH